MASSRVISKLSSRLQQTLAPKLNQRSLSLELLSPMKKSCPNFQVPVSPIRISRTSRLPLELSSLESMMPLHNAIASARLTSILSIDSQSWGLIPQGISMPL